MGDDINALRAAINRINDKITRLFVQRMELAEKVADYKIAHRLPVFDAAREEDILQHAAEAAGEKYAGAAKKLFSEIMALSRSAQEKRILAANASAEFPQNP